MRHSRIPTICAVALIFAVLAFMSGCSDRPSAKYRIGVSQCSSDDWRNKMNSEILREIMFHPDAEVEIRSAGDDSDRQIADIRYFADNGFDIIIAAPNQADALTPVIKEVYEKGLPVIIFDRDINGDTYTARMAVDNRALGNGAARYARHIVPSGEVRVLEIEGLMGSTPARERHHGFSEGVDSIAGMKILASAKGNWNREDAVKVTDSLLNLYPETNLIYAHNDRMAIGASEVAHSMGRTDIRIIGIDAAPEIGVRAVADGVIDATFLYPTEGQRVVRLALDILNGETFSKENMLPMASPVDESNADILLLQNESLKEETAKMEWLKSQVDEYWSRHSAQTTLFYASVVIVILLLGVIFLLLRVFWQYKRYQANLLDKNRQLAEERDKQEELNRQLSDATQSKLAFYTNVSHDLRTPLTLIAEPLEQLSHAANLTSSQRTVTEIANRNVRILHRLINQILDFRKYENGNLNCHLTETPLARLLGEWTEAFAPLAARRHVKLKFESMVASGFTIAVDVEKMERVVFNLLSNAMKFTPPNGAVSLSCTESDGLLLISVKDTGIGIPAGELKNVFERFYQVDAVNPQGSGIGLWLVKSFVELHGGTVTIESAHKQGTVFNIVIPVRHVEDSTEASQLMVLDSTEILKELDTASADSVTIDEALPIMLVIDDNADMRSLISQVMGGEYNVLQAPDGAEGLRMAAKYVPDIILCDVMMPVMDGMECCRRIKSEVSTSHIPVLMLTACTLDEQRVKGYDSGADAYLGKPFSGAMLRSRCANLIANRRRIKELYAADGVVAHPFSSQDADRKVSAGRDTQHDMAPKFVADIDNNFYSRFLQEVERVLDNPDVGVDDLAAAMGLGRSQFYRKIKALTNFSPVELLRQMRLKRARTLLTTTEKNISEIAYETGFSTPAYFTKCFRDAFGETPSELREGLGIRR
ncbi:MAG: substrate-binding domain-containing protein [Bacteroidales bacterium]|nr:substrate-binding domain-containing protein [Bacteroidales bacterium]